MKAPNPIRTPLLNTFFICLVLFTTAQAHAHKKDIADPNWPHPRSDEWIAERHNMAQKIRKHYGLKDQKVLNALRNVPRHWFVPKDKLALAYADTPLPIGYDQTISQPYIVAIMTDLINPELDHIVLEVGTGSGYQAAVLSKLVQKVYSIEIIPQLAKKAKQTLEKLGYKNVFVRQGDGYKGWPDVAPFDGIIVTAGGDVPPRLVEQLKPGGR